MTDLDHWSRVKPARWGRVGRLIQGGACAPVIESSANKALAGSLRDAGGCPGLVGLTNALEMSILSGDERPWDAACAAAPDHPHTKLAVRAGESLMERLGGRAQPWSEDLRTTFAHEVVHRLAVHYVERTRQGFVPGTGGADAVLNRFANECDKSIDVEHFARQLRRDPSGHTIRAPRRRSAPTGTAALLNRPIGRGTA